MAKSSQPYKNSLIEKIKDPIIIATLIIALTGGIPGIINIINYFDNKPIIKINISSVETGFISKESERSLNLGRMYFLFACNMVNTGQKSLFPNIIQGYMRCNGTEIRLFSSIIPKHFDSLLRVNNVTSINYIDLVKNDIQKVKKIPGDEVVYGNFFCLSQQMNLQDFSTKYYNKIELRIKCIDAFGGEYYSDYFKVTNENTVKVPTAYPKNDLEVIPK